jgi:hypothetical protein
MERYEQLLNNIRTGVRDLQDFLRGMAKTSLPPPMPSEVYYTTPEILAHVAHQLERLYTDAVELEGEIDDIVDELESYV